MADAAAVVTSMGIGICYHPSHIIPFPTTGYVINGYPNITIGTNASAVTTGIVLSTCGHIGILITGSSKFTSGNLAQCKIGSIFTGFFQGQIVTGYPNFQLGG